MNDNVSMNRWTPVDMCRHVNVGTIKLLGFCVWCYTGCSLPHRLIGEAMRGVSRIFRMVSSLAHSCEQLTRQLPRASIQAYKINHLPNFLPLCILICHSVMQDKGLPNFVARICTTLSIPPAMCWHDMYSLYIFLKIWPFITGRSSNSSPYR